MKKTCIIAIAMLALGSCITGPTDPVHKNSSDNFQVAKAVIELTSITKDKDAIKRFKTVESSSPAAATLYPKFGEWYVKFGETVADKAVDRVLKMKIAGE